MKSVLFSPSVSITRHSQAYGQHQSEKKLESCLKLMSASSIDLLNIAHAKSFINLLVRKPFDWQLQYVKMLKIVRLRLPNGHWSYKYPIYIDIKYLVIAGDTIAEKYHRFLLKQSLTTESVYEQLYELNVWYSEITLHLFIWYDWTICEAVSSKPILDIDLVHEYRQCIQYAPDSNSKAKIRANEANRKSCNMQREKERERGKKHTVKIHSAEDTNKIQINSLFKLFLLKVLSLTWIIIRWYICSASRKSNNWRWSGIVGSMLHTKAIALELEVNI